MNLLIRKILKNEVVYVSKILTDVSRWLIDIDQELWSLEQVSVNSLLNTYKIDGMYVGFVNNEPVATMILQESDPLFWPNLPASESLFLHKLAVIRAYKGKGISIQMLDWAVSHAKKKGRSYLRLDCAADRPKLHQLYESFGFQKVDQRMVSPYYTSFYELNLEPTSEVT